MTGTTTAATNGGYYPSILDLGRYLSTIDTLSRQLEDLKQPTGTDPRLSLLYQQEAAIQKVIAARSACDLQEATVQIAVACDTVQHLDGCDWSNPDSHNELTELIGMACRLLLSAMPLIADAASLGMVSMGWTDLELARSWTFEGARPDA